MKVLIIFFISSLICLTRCERTTVSTPSGKNDSVPIVLVAEQEKNEEYKTMKMLDLAPKCNNFLRNVLAGRWLPKMFPSHITPAQKKRIKLSLKQKREQLDKDMKFVWKTVGIPSNPWRSTKYCGYYRLRETVGARPPIGSWCDPNSETPCCNNLLYGVCVRARQGQCSCPSCVDVRKMDHAELMDWTPYTNFWCKWRHYTATEACDVIEHSPVKELYYVGDSYMQSMYLSLLMILTNKPITGSWKKGDLSLDEYSKCSNYGLNNFKSCRAMIQSLDEMRFKDSLCGDGRNVTFKAEFKKYYSSKFGKDFQNFMKPLVGKPGTYVVVGIGFHVGMDLTLAIKHFMNPAMAHIRAYYNDKPDVPSNKRWPQVLFSMPMDYGILKPTRYLKAQYITKQMKFEGGMRSYCKRNNIQVLDFTPLTKNVHTWDGIHYGVGVNTEKNQIFLNYLATLK